MKKIFIILAMLLFTVGNCFAKCEYNCVEPYDLSNGFSRFMSTVTGSRALGNTVAQSILKKQIAKNIEGKLDVDIKSYSVKDLKKGIFKSITIKGKNVDLDGVAFTSIKMQTLCKFNYISFEKEPVFKEDLPIAFYVELTQDDLNKTMQTENYKRIISDVNRLGGSVFKVVSSRINIHDDKLYYILKVAVPFVRKTQNIVLESDLKVSHGEIDFANTRLVNGGISLKNIDKVINFLNPLDFSLNILENKNADLAVENVKINGNKIIADGIILISKDDYER